MLAFLLPKCRALQLAFLSTQSLFQPSLLQRR